MTGIEAYTIYKQELCGVRPSQWDIRWSNAHSQKTEAEFAQWINQKNSPKRANQFILPTFDALEERERFAWNAFAETLTDNPNELQKALYQFERTERLDYFNDIFLDIKDRTPVEMQAFHKIIDLIKATKKLEQDTSGGCQLSYNA